MKLGDEPFQFCLSDLIDAMKIGKKEFGCSVCHYHLHNRKDHS